MFIRNYACWKLKRYVICTLTVCYLLLKSFHHAVPRHPYACRVSRQDLKKKAERETRWKQQSWHNVCSTDHVASILSNMQIYVIFRCQIWGNISSVTARFLLVVVVLEYLVTMKTIVLQLGSKPRRQKWHHIKNCWIMKCPGSSEESSRRSRAEIHCAVQILLWIVPCARLAVLTRKSKKKRRKVTAC